MRRLGFIFTLFCLSLAACAAPPADMPATRTATPSATLTPLDIAQDEPDTPTPDTWSSSLVEMPTITPLPTIPTFTPTFDVRTIVTATPAPRAECPQIVSLPPDVDLGFLDLSWEQTENRLSIEKNLLVFLNQYGHHALYKVITTHNLPDFSDVRIEDWTNDGQPEMIVGAIWFYVFGCQNGEYVSLLKVDPTWELAVPKIYAVTDANRDNIPEVTLRVFVSRYGEAEYQIYQWNGTRFANLIFSPYEEFPDSGSFWITFEGKIQYKDIKDDFVQELILDNTIHEWHKYNEGWPWRHEKIIYLWNGKHYVPGYREFVPPEFRFQAIQDGDLALSQQEYAKAIELYQQAIFDAELKAYSPEIRKNLRDAWTARIGPDKTPTPVSPDPTEYPRLAAYAYYRMVILHTFLGEMDSARVKYATMMEKFPAGSPGHPYVEMATDFWNAYQSSGRMYEACAAAIAYADSHPEILVPLGSDYHGWQSHQYQAGVVQFFGKG